MSRRWIILHCLWLLATMAILAFLWEWSWAAMVFSFENMEKPFRGLFRIAFSACIMMILLGSQVLVARRAPR
jgi:hypothetical protein